MAKLSILHGFLILFLSHALAVEDVTSCNILLQFPTSQSRQAELELLPPYFHNRPLSQGLKHIVRLAKQGTQKQTKDGTDITTTYLIPMDNFNPRELKPSESVGYEEVLNLPEDFLSPQEIQDLRPQIKSLGFENVLDSSYEIPILTTYPIPRIKIEGYIHNLAATSEGYPVMIVNLPSGRGIGALKDRANDSLILAGFKILSDFRVIPNLMGVTKAEDGSLKGVFSIPAGHQNLDLKMLLGGIEIIKGLRGKNEEEPFEIEVARIQGFENLIQRLMDSQWPMINYSLDLAEQIKIHPDLNLKAVFDLIKMPIWENSENMNEDPFLFPNLFDSNSTWFPKIFNNPLRDFSKKSSEINDIVVTTMSSDRSLPMKDRLIRLKLQSLHPLSTFGRVTMLRFDFFTSILNKKAKIEYLNFIYKKSPEEYKALLELIKYLAVPLNLEPIQTFVSNYQAVKVRSTFQVIDKEPKN